MTPLLTLLACLHGAPPSELSQARVPEIPGPPRGCALVAKVPVRGVSSCGVGGECQAQGRLFDAVTSEAVPRRKAHCSVAYDRDARRGTYTIVVHDEGLVGAFTCLVDGGDWLRLSLTPHATSPSPEVEAWYGRGLMRAGSDAPRFGLECSPGTGQQDW
ncbi:MAG: hypothetical protein VX899_12505 [Myxococcota bacterium]|nr:hypothetical protein [Myxococcota bacterium]